MQSAATQDKAAKVAGLQDLYGPLFDRAMKELSEEGLDPRFRVLAAARCNPALARTLAEAIEAGGADVEKDAAKTQAIRDDVRDGTADAASTGQPGGETVESIEAIRSAAEDLGVQFFRQTGRKDKSVRRAAAFANGAIEEFRLSGSDDEDVTGVGDDALSGGEGTIDGSDDGSIVTGGEGDQLGDEGADVRPEQETLSPEQENQILATLEEASGSALAGGKGADTLIGGIGREKSPAQKGKAEDDSGRGLRELLSHVITGEQLERLRRLGGPRSGSQGGPRPRSIWVIGLGGGFNGILFLVDSNTRLPALAPDGKPFLLTVDRAREIFDMVRKLGARDPGNIAPGERRRLREFAENVEAYLDFGKRRRSRLRRIKDRRIKRPESLGEPGSGSRSGAKTRPRWVIDSNAMLALVDPDTGKPVLAPDGKPFSLAPGRSREILDLMGAWGAKDAGKMTREELRTLHEFARNVDAYLGVGEPAPVSGPEDSTDEKAPTVVARKAVPKKERKRKPVGDPLAEEPVDKEEGNALTRWLRELRESFEDFFKLPSDLPPNLPPPGGPPPVPGRFPRVFRPPIFR